MGADQSKPKSSRHQKPEAASQPTSSRSFHDVVEDEGTPVDTDVIGGQALEGGEAADGLVPEDQRLQFSLSGLPEETSECAEAELICIGKVESRYKHPKYPEDQLKEDNLSDDDQRSRQADDIDTCDISDDDKPSHEADDIDTNDIEQEKLREENNFAVCTKALPVIRNEQNQLKKKATKDIDDNRLHCADAETDNRVTEIMSNIIFLPDKTKGASPKRYGPKRLGSPGRLEDFPQVDDSSDEENKYVEQDKDKNTIGEIQRITYGDDNTREKNAKPPDVGILNNSPGEESQRGIVFVDDHFGLDTGATASGVSDCFQTGNQQTAPTADFNQNQHSQENSHNKLIGEQNTAEVITQTSSSLPDRRGMQKTFTENGIKQTTHLYNKTCETAQSLFEKTKVNEHHSKSTIEEDKMKGELAQTTEGRRKDPGPDVEETEVQDVCARCKETKGLCGCIIFEDDRVVLSVTKFEKPYIVPMRFQKFHGKELPWQIMKSKQALFASELKSCKTDFARDNRIAFEFTLPIYTGKDPHEIGDIDVNEFDIDDSCAFEGEFSLPLKLNYTNINDDISSFSASNFLNNNQFDSISTSSSDTPCKCADIEQEGLVEDCDRKVWLDGTLQCGKHASISFEWMKCEGGANIPSSVRLDSIVPCDSPDNCDFPSFDTSLCDTYIDGQPPNLKVEVNSNTNDVVVESKSLNVATDTNEIVSGSIDNQKTSTSDENRLSAKCFANAQQLGQANSLSSFSNLSTDTVVRDTTDETLVSVINGDDGHDDNIPAKVRENTVLSNCKVAHLKGANLGHDEEADEIKDVDKPTEAEPEDSDYTSNSVDVLDEYLISICDTENELQTDVGLANILKRKVTRTEDDNRIIVLRELKENDGREPESEVISNINENANLSGEEKNAENKSTTITGNSIKEIHVPPSDTLYDMFKRMREGITRPPSEFHTILQESFETLTFKRPDSSPSRIRDRGEGEMSEFARSLFESLENGLEPEEDRSSTSTSPMPSTVSSGRSSPFGTETGVDVTFPSSHCETLEMEDLLGAVGGRAEKGKIADIENVQQSSEVNDLVPDLPDHWTGYMQEQLLKCKKVEGLPRSFRATVFCVDASRHVSSTEWSHVCRSLKTFLEYVGWVRREFGIEEYVALVITGTETSVTVHLTSDLKRVEAALDTVKPGGECFMLPALALSMYCLAPFQGRSFPQVHDVIMENRIIVISAGHVSHWSHSMPVDGGTGQNVTDTGSAIQEITDSIRKWPWKAIKVQLHLVPGVGQVDMVFFEEIGSVPLPETKVVVHESHGGSLDMEQLARSTHNHYITGQITCQMFRASEAFQRDVFCNLVQTLFPDRTHRDLASMCEIAETAHAEYVAQKNEPESGDSWRLERKELPLLGSRVTVGPDMDESTKACVAGRGTVVGHLKSGGQVSVCWDNGYQNECCFNPKGKYEALPDDSPVNGRGHDVIRPGFTVRRGPDWAYGEQDGGPDQVGHVLHVSRDRSVLVRWPNGRLQNYRYNCGGLYDVVISDADDPLGMEAYTTKMNKRNMQRCTAQPDLCLTVAAGGRD